MLPWAHTSLPTLVNGMSIGSSIFAQLTCMPNTETETTKRVARVAIGRIYATHAMRPKSNVAVET